jgi:signal transduction histidine kinase
MLFTSKGKVTVAVDLFQEDEHNVVLKFSIKDTGIGISEDKIGSIFENFQQATMELLIVCRYGFRTSNKTIARSTRW